MGYEAPRKIIRLIFDDDDLAGLEVRVRSLPLGKVLQVAELDDLDPGNLTREDIPKIREIFGMLVSSMVSWNLEEDGVPVELSLSGLMDQDPAFVFRIVRAWMNALNTVPDPLASPSLDGERSLEASIPMDVLSGSRAS